MAPATASTSLAAWFSSDARFQQLYPQAIQDLSSRHWTPLRIAQLATRFLVPHKNVKILDIGSGAGKFCLAGAWYHGTASFVGVEQRKSLVTHAETARAVLGLRNVCFIHGNFTQLDFRQYDHFYFYNAFHENLAFTDKIDDSIAYSVELYNYYNRYLYKKLEEMPTGTRVVTFYSLSNEIPPCYQLAEAQIDNLLKCWIKT